MAQTAHLNIVRNSTGHYFVEAAKGADRIDLTPPLASVDEASQALTMIQRATGLPVGRSV